MRIGVTGHTNLAPASVPLVTDAIRDHLCGRLGGTAGLIGVSCLAPGADSLFADVVIELGGRLEAIIPSADYRDTKVNPDHAPAFDRLVALATVRTMPFPKAGRKAYIAANRAMLARVDELVAVWDGRPAAHAGGTAAVVAEAQDHGIPVTVIWPPGTTRGS